MEAGQKLTREHRAGTICWELGGTPIRDRVARRLAKLPGIEPVDLGLFSDPELAQTYSYRARF
jgi:hypothetical protein